MAIIDHTNNFVQSEIRNYSLKAFELEENTYTSDIINDVPSKQSTGTYFFYEPRHFMTSQVTERQAGDVSPNAKYGVGTQTYAIPEFSLRVPVTSEEIANSSDNLAPLRDAAMFLVSNFIVKHEVDFANTYLADAAAWTFRAEGQIAATTGPIDGDPKLAFGVGAGKFTQFDQASSEPLRILKKMMLIQQAETGVRPNKLIIPRLVFEEIENNDSVKAFAANTLGVNGGQEQTKAIIALHLGLPVDSIKIIDMVYNNVTPTVVDAVIADLENHKFGKNSTIPGVATMAWVGGKNVLFLYVGPSIGKYTKTGASRFLWNGLTDVMRGDIPEAAAPTNTGTDLGNMFIHSYYHKDSKTHYVDGIFAYDHEIVAPDLGMILKDAIA